MLSETDVPVFSPDIIQGPVYCLKLLSRENSATVQAPEMGEARFGGSSIVGTISVGHCFILSCCLMNSGVP